MQRIKNLLMWRPRIRTTQYLQLIVLIVSACAIGWQLYQQSKTNKIDQLIAWKSAIQGLNQLAMEYPVIFHTVLYPKAEGPYQVKQLTAAYSSLHALEVMYYMRKDEETPPERLDIFLREYVAGCTLREAWKVDAAHTAFTKDFREKLNEIITRNPKDCPKKEQEPAADQQALQRQRYNLKIVPFPQDGEGKKQKQAEDQTTSASPVSGKDGSASSLATVLRDLSQYSIEITSQPDK